ncbi:hypothetical protein LSUCC0031_00170 [Rhodobacterales bacterium LSUCC0031]|nr:hypothetical protein [Rhodobacterales bacterium LSUCC0031]
MLGIKEIGTLPWSYEDIRGAYPEFAELYAQRPLKTNDGGMKAPHMFATWYMLRKLQPSLIVESGVWYGQGTWIIEQACPDARLVCIDLEIDRIAYRSKRAEYHSVDFDLVNFGDHDLTNALCFWDDHQNALRRLQQMAWKGFRQAIFEDNYPAARGDCYSLKKAFAGVGFTPEIQGVKEALKWSLIDRLGQKLQAFKLPPNTTHAAELRRICEVYYEFPPLVRPPQTRWGDPWTDEAYPTKEAVFTDGLDSVTEEEAVSYNWICYTRICSHRR